MLLTVVEVFGFGWRGAADVVEEPSVVEPVDPFQGREFEVIEASPGAPVADEFGLVEPDRLLSARPGRRIILDRRSEDGF